VDRDVRQPSAADAAGSWRLTVTFRVASLPDIIKSKRAARRPRDIAVLDVLEKALEETNRQKAKPGRAHLSK